MTFPSSGPITFTDIRNESGVTGPVSFSNYRVRSMGNAGQCTSQISMSDLYNGPNGNYRFTLGPQYQTDWESGGSNDDEIMVRYPSRAGANGEKKQTHLFFFSYGPGYESSFEPYYSVENAQDQKYGAGGGWVKRVDKHIYPISMQYYNYIGTLPSQQLWRNQGFHVATKWMAITTRARGTNADILTNGMDDFGYGARGPASSASGAAVPNTKIHQRSADNVSVNNEAYFVISAAYDYLYTPYYELLDINGNPDDRATNYADVGLIQSEDFAGHLSLFCATWYECQGGAGTSAETPYYIKWRTPQNGYIRTITKYSVPV